jgi:hypothetical protein
MPVTPHAYAQLQRIDAEGSTLFPPSPTATATSVVKALILLVRWQGAHTSLACALAMLVPLLAWHTSIRPHQATQVFIAVSSSTA